MIDTKQAEKDFNADVKIAGKLIVSKPAQAADIGMDLAKAQARYETIAWWNRELDDITEYLDDHELSPEHILLIKYAALSRYAMKGADDSWSGRGNDARRAMDDMRRDVLRDIEFELRTETQKLGKK